MNFYDYLTSNFFSIFIALLSSFYLMLEEMSREIFKNDLKFSSWLDSSNAVAIY